MAAVVAAICNTFATRPVVSLMRLLPGAVYPVDDAESEHLGEELRVTAIGQGAAMPSSHHAHVLVGTPRLHQPLRQLLQEAGFEVTTFDRATAALLAERQHPPATLIIDHAVPNPRGDRSLSELLAQASADAVTVIGLPPSLVRLDDEQLLATLLRSFLAATLPRASLMRAPSSAV